MDGVEIVTAELATLNRRIVVLRRELSEARERLTGLDIENARLRTEVAAYRASSDHWERLYLGVARKKAGGGLPCVGMDRLSAAR